TAVSNSIHPPCTRSTRSSAPTTSAPASRASRSFSPLAKTATRTVLPIPCGSTTAPRTIWSACLGSTPSRNERSTDSSNFAAGMSLMRASASSTEYCLSASIFVVAASYRLLTVAVAISFSLMSLDDVDAHAAGGAFDDPHGGVDGLRVQVHELGLRDLAHLLLRDLADLVLVRHGRRLRDPRRALEEHGGGRRVDRERERPILIDRHDDGQDQPFLVAGLRVEALAELHDVHAVLAERRPDGRGRIRLPRGDLQLHHRLDFLCHGLTGAPPGSTRARPASAGRRRAPRPSCARARD